MENNVGMEKEMEERRKFKNGVEYDGKVINKGVFQDKIEKR